MDVGIVQFVINVHVATNVKLAKVTRSTVAIRNVKPILVADVNFVLETNRPVVTVFVT